MARSQSTRLAKSSLTLSALLCLLAAIAGTVARPRRTIEQFANHLAQSRYAVAALMLKPPSAVELAADGSLVVTDSQGRVTTVAAERLPFLVGGGQKNGPGVFSMTALQGAPQGVLVGPPAVTLSLSLDGGRVQIDRVAAAPSITD